MPGWCRAPARPGKPLPCDYLRRARGKQCANFDEAGLCTDSLATNAWPRAPMSQGSCGGCLRHRQAYLRVGLAQSPTPRSLPLQTSSGGTRCLPPRDSSSVCLQSPGSAQTIELAPCDCSLKPKFCGSTDDASPDPLDAEHVKRPQTETGPDSTRLKL